MNNKELYQLLNEVEPVFFDLGFIECKISDKERIHFYHPELKIPVNALDNVRNHRYDFVGKVLRGHLQNKIYNFFDGKHNTHYKLSELFTNDIKNGKKNLGYLNLFSDLNHQVNETYAMHNMYFNKIEANFCITQLKCTADKKDTIDIVYPIASNFIEPLKRSLSKQDCLAIIKECIEMNHRVLFV